VIARIEPADRQLASPLGQTSPLVKLAVAIGWFIGLAFTTDVRPPIVLACLALLAAIWLGRVDLGTLASGLAPLWVAALAIGLFNTLFAAANLDPSAAELIQIGPFRLTQAALVGGVGLAARVLAFATVGVVFAQTTDPTRLVDALVQQARMPPRFAYGALAAYQAVPGFAEDLATLRQSRRIRGLPGSWHPRILVGLLVQAIRHANRLALAMDARGFGMGPRTTFRQVRWTVADGLLLAGGVAALALALFTSVGRPF
jgi:energy-coupling factor transport system permease protein